MFVAAGVTALVERSPSCKAGKENNNPKTLLTELALLSVLEYSSFLT